LGRTVTKCNLIQEENNRTLSLGNACYHSVQKLLSFHLLSKNTQIRIYKTIILFVVPYGYENRFLTLKEEHILRVFENRELRIYGPKIIEVIKGWKKCISRCFMICTLFQV
jgi:hypothetical protein